MSSNEGLATLVANLPLAPSHGVEGGVEWGGQTELFSNKAEKPAKKGSLSPHFPS